MQIVSRLNAEGGAIEPSVANGTIADRPMMLELHFKDGRTTAFGYNYLYRIDADGAGTIVLHFMSDIVTLQGRELGNLVAGLHAQVERRIVESDDLHGQYEPGATISSIRVEPQRQ